MTEQVRAIGKIIKVSSEGWGFLSSRDIQFTRIFFHWTALKQDTLKFTELKTGMRCEFTPVKIEGRGYRAIQMKIIPKEQDNDVSTLSERRPENDGTNDAPIEPNAMQRLLENMD